MADVEDIFDDNDFFGGVVHTPNEGIDQHKKREDLKKIIDKGQGTLIRA